MLSSAVDMEPISFCPWAFRFCYLIFSDLSWASFSLFNFIYSLIFFNYYWSFFISSIFSCDFFSWFFIWLISFSKFFTCSLLCFSSPCSWFKLSEDLSFRPKSWDRVWPGTGNLLADSDFFFYFDNSILFYSSFAFDADLCGNWGVSCFFKSFNFTWSSFKFFNSYFSLLFSSFILIFSSLRCSFILFINAIELLSIIFRVD